MYEADERLRWQFLPRLESQDLAAKPSFTTTLSSVEYLVKWVICGGHQGRADLATHPGIKWVSSKKVLRPPPDARRSAGSIRKFGHIAITITTRD